MRTRAILGVFLLIGCGGSTAPVAQRPRPLVTCTGSLSVAADTRATPRFTWTPGCGATYLEVASPDNRQSFWIIRGDTGKIGPGVTYGVEPPGFTSRFGPFPLESGAWYTVRLGVMVDEDSYALVGEGVFQR